MSKLLSLRKVAVAALATSMLLPAQRGEATAPPPEAGSATAQDPAPEEQGDVDLAAMLVDFHPMTGTVKLREHGSIALAEGWLWLAGADGQRFLVALGNRMDPDVNGVAIAPDYTDSGMFAVYSHSEEGHVDDEEPDYDDLLQSMRDGEEDDNAARRKAKVATVHTLGWAEPPHYDKVGHKLYWATKLQFEGNDGPTLNYNVRVLGRTGTIDMIGVGGIEQLPLVAEHCKNLLAVTEFVDGKRYSDFDPQYDKIAAYGIGGLIAGKVALKVGLFAKLGVLLLKFLKPILVGVAILGAALFKVFGGKKQPAARPRRAAESGGIADHDVAE